ncbi:MAG TPA: diguanylate cyclase [Thiobacillaceae bacterium]|nr:diguanylate cyclase [Thiobacillaceae bacterium]HNU63438.1 diguanylate cyclase [Thiobacillaceae bacterium]
MEPAAQHDPRYALSPVNAEFRDLATEVAFREHMRPIWVRDTRRAFILAALFYLAFSITDFLMMGQGEPYATVLFTRVLVTCLALFVAFSANRYWRLLMDGITPTLVVALAMAGFLSITLLRPFDPGWHGMSMMVMLLGTYVFIPNRYLPALTVALISTVVFFYLMVDHFELPAKLSFIMGLLFLGMNLFGAMSAHRISRLTRMNFRDEQILRQANQRLTEEVMARRRLEQDLINQVHHDELTGATNRRRFQELARLHMRQAEAGRQALSLLLLDLDYFKQINDTYGQLRGDEVLKSLVRVCQGLGPVDMDEVVARLGGEEFAMLLPGLDQEAARMHAEHIRASIWNTPVTLTDAAIHITVSIGVVQWHPGESLAELLNRADQALQLAKCRGRNRVAVAEEGMRLPMSGPDSHNTANPARTQ